MVLLVVGMVVCLGGRGRENCDSRKCKHDELVLWLVDLPADHDFSFSRGGLGRRDLVIVVVVTHPMVVIVFVVAVVVVAAMVVEDRLCLDAGRGEWVVLLVVGMVVCLGGGGDEVCYQREL